MTRANFTLPILLCALLFASAPGEAATSQEAARWLSLRLQHPIKATQLLAVPQEIEFEQCSVTRVRRTPTGNTSVTLRCANQALPQLLVIGAELTGSSYPVPPAPGVHRTNVPPVVRAGTALRGEWQTSSMHAVLPLIAMQSGNAGEQIRVRISGSSRVLSARIVDSHQAVILSGDAL